MLGDTFVCEECARSVSVTNPSMEVGHPSADGKERCPSCWYRFKQKELLERRKKRETKPQHQGSLDEQIRILIGVANKEGLYDAADYLLRDLERCENNLRVAREAMRGK